MELLIIAGIGAVAAFASSFVSGFSTSIYGVWLYLKVYVDVLLVVPDSMRGIAAYSFL